MGASTFGLLRRGALLSLVWLVASGDAGASSGVHREELFRIKRSLNRNVVEFDVRVLPDGHVDPKRPVDAYWRLFAEDGRTEELTWLEKQFAYGYAVESRPGGLVLKLLALPDRSVRIEPRDGRFVATLPIRGKSAVLDHVFVQVEGSLFGPKVRFVEIHGTVDQTGHVVERIQAH